MKPICYVAGCETVSSKTGLCERHYKRKRKTGSTDDRQKSHNASEKCSVTTCIRTRANSVNLYCSLHDDRLRRTGSLNLKTKGLILDSPGYEVVTPHGHPLANGKYRIRVHRIVLYDNIGPGEHPCYHCKRLVSWDKKFPEHYDALVVDHLDDDKLNNDISNLVPSCAACNTSRSHWKTKKTKREMFAVHSFGGLTLCITQWAERIGLSPSSMWRRLNSNWSPERIFTSPPTRARGQRSQYKPA